MRHKIILLVSSRKQEAAQLRDRIHEEDHSINVITLRSGQAALDALMGGFENLKGQYRMRSAIKPEVVFLDKHLPDMAAHELLGIVRKYYSMDAVRFYITGENFSEAERRMYDAVASGCVITTIKDARFQIANQEIFLAALGKSHLALFPALITFASSIKAKAAVVKTGLTTSKIAACLAGGAIVCTTAAMVLQSGNDHVRDVAPLSVEAIVPDNYTRDTTSTIVPAPEQEMVMVPEKSEPVSVPAEEVTPVSSDTVIAEKQVAQSPDTTRHRTYSIGVRPSGDAH